jgi:hypothetical protein
MLKALGYIVLFIFLLLYSIVTVLETTPSPEEMETCRYHTEIPMGDDEFNNWYSACDKNNPVHREILTKAYNRYLEEKNKTVSLYMINRYFALAFVFLFVIIFMGRR